MTSGKPGFLVAAASVVVCMLAVTSVFGDRGLLEIRDLRAKEAALRGRADALEAHNEKLRDDVRRLRDDDAYLERVARERQGLVKPGETVYRFPEH